MKVNVLYLFVLIVAFASACSKHNSGSHTVRYKVGGAAKLNVSYTDGNMAFQSATGVDSTWSYSFTTNADGSPVHLSVTSQDTSEVSGYIFIDNQQSNQNNGNHTISISAQIP